MKIYNICKVIEARLGGTLILKLKTGDEQISKPRWIGMFSESESEDPIKNKWAREARVYLEKHLVGKEIIVFSYGEDDNGLMLSDWYLKNNPRAEVPFLNSTYNVQYKLVLLGLAWVCLPNVPVVMNNDEDHKLWNTLPGALYSAYRQNRGIWKDVKKGRLV